MFLVLVLVQLPLLLLGSLLWFGGVNNFLCLPYVESFHQQLLILLLQIFPALATLFDSIHFNSKNLFGIYTASIENRSQGSLRRENVLVRVVLAVELGFLDARKAHVIIRTESKRCHRRRALLRAHFAFESFELYFAKDTFGRGVIPLVLITMTGSLHDANSGRSNVQRGIDGNIFLARFFA